MGLRETLEAATPGPWSASGKHVKERTHRSLIATISPFYGSEADARLIALAPELAALCLDMGDLLRLPVDEIQEGDAEDVLARLDQIGKEQTDG
jgi:hypothetical protein